MGSQCLPQLVSDLSLDVVDGVGLAADTGTDLGLDLVSEDEGLTAKVSMSWIFI